MLHTALVIGGFLVAVVFIAAIASRVLDSVAYDTRAPEPWHDASPPSNEPKR